MPEIPTSVRLIRFGAFQVDLHAGEIRKKGTRIKLQPQPFQLLVLLLKGQGDVVTREEIRVALWPDGTFIDFDHSLGTAVNKLREVLGDSAATPRFIETLPRRGYRFLASIELDDIPEGTSALIDALPQEPGLEEASEEPVSGPSVPPSRALLWPRASWLPVLATLIVWCSALAVSRLYSSNPSPIRSIAVRRWRICPAIHHKNTFQMV